ncbi:copper amine oxidase N-terminal domain-containing protein [Paenibacillus mesophilus]|nr:copper amine oxidase N-terminal domain-containing protein [Paenibacillus mesophilus]
MQLLVGTALLANFTPGAMAEQTRLDQRTQAEVEAVRLLSDQGVAPDTLELLGPKAELAADVLRSRQPSRQELDRLIDGLVKYLDGPGTISGNVIEGKAEYGTGELYVPRGAVLVERMLSRKPMELSLNDQLAVVAPWEEFLQPVYLGDSVYFPLYRMMTMLGGDAEWNGADWEVTAIAPWGARWKIPIGGNEVRNQAGETLATLSNPTLLVDNQVLVPYDFWNTITGYRVDWDQSGKSLLVVTEPLFNPQAPVLGYAASALGYVVADLNMKVNGRYARLTHLPISYEGIVYYPMDLVGKILDLSAAYDSQTRRLKLETDNTIRSERSGQPVQPSPRISAFAVDLIPFIQYSFNNQPHHQLTYPLVVNQGRLYVPINELAAIAGYRVDYTAADKTLHLTKPLSGQIRDKLMPGLPRDDVRALLGNQLKVVYDTSNGTRSWEYRFLADAAIPSVESPEQKVPDSMRSGRYAFAVVDREALRSEKLSLQLFVHHEPNSKNMSGYSLYTNTPEGILETTLNSDGSLTERLLTDG